MQSIIELIGLFAFPAYIGWIINKAGIWAGLTSAAATLVLVAEYYTR